MNPSKTRNDATPSTNTPNESISIGTQNDIKKTRKHLETKKKNIVMDLYSNKDLYRYFQAYSKLKRKIK